LYRTNSQSRVFEEAMRRACLPYNIVGGFSFYERMEVRDIISYLKLALNPNDSIALQRVINSPPRGIGKQTLDELTRRAAVIRTGSGSDRVASDVQSPMSNVQSPTGAGSADILSAGASGSELGSPPIRTGSRSERVDDASAESNVEGAQASTGTAGVSPAMSAASANSPGVREGAAAGSLSLWDTIALVIDDPQNLSARAVSALRSFRRIILRLAEMAGTSSVDGQSSSVALPSDIVKAAILDTGYENALKSEKTDEAEARLENLQELVNAAVDYDEQGIEGLRDFIDHSALVSDTDQYKGDAPVTLMTAHSAKGLEFPLVFIVGLEDGLFPHSRSATDPAELEEERRLCYVAMTRAERFLYVTHAMKRRVYGEELASEPSQFLNEMPLELMEDLSRGNSWLSFARGSSAIDYDRGSSPTVREGAIRTGSRSDQVTASDRERGSSPTMREGASGYRSSDRGSARKDNTTYTGKTYDSVDSIAEFFKQRATQLGNTGGTFQSTRERAEREKSDQRKVQHPKSNVQHQIGTPTSRGSDRVQTPNSEPRTPNPSPVLPSSVAGQPSSSDFVPGSYVKHAKYGRGLVLRREGVGDSLKLTVTFPGYGQKKLVQKYAGLEKA
jgi:DNA helicase-2/ATP-dependent DNA helicase PcrA